MTIPLFHYLNTILLLAIIGCLSAGRTLGQDAKPKDFTNFKFDEHGVKPVAPKKDAKTGFAVGGVNSTESLAKLTELNGKAIADLEKRMRPGAMSRSGFMGKDEKLLDILVDDNKYIVEELGLTHQELAKHLHAMGAIWHWQAANKQADAAFNYHGRNYRVDGASSPVTVISPFEDGTKGSTNITIRNLDNNKSLSYSLLVPHMIERYGFYEGKGTFYRLDPRKAVEVLDFLKTKTKK